MKKLLFCAVLVGGLLASNTSAKHIEQTICFSKSDCNNAFSPGVLGDDVKLCGGKCQGRTLGEMNRAGWKLIQVVNGLESAFGMVFIKEK